MFVKSAVTLSIAKCWKLIAKLATSILLHKDAISQNSVAVVGIQNAWLATKNWLMIKTLVILDRLKLFLVSMEIYLHSLNRILNSWESLEICQAIFQIWKSLESRDKVWKNGKKSGNFFCQCYNCLISEYSFLWSNPIQSCLWPKRLITEWEVSQLSYFHTVPWVLYLGGASWKKLGSCVFQGLCLSPVW